MKEYCLVRKQGKQKIGVWDFNVTDVMMIGRADGVNPEIDLNPDQKISRQHASLWFADSQWWIEDQHSANGTAVNGQSISGTGANSLNPWDEIQLGDTLLMLIPSHRYRLKNQQVVIDCDIYPSINFSLVHCGQPLVSHLTVQNLGHQPTAVGTLDIAIPGCTQIQECVIPALQPGSSEEIDPPTFQIDYQNMEVWTEGTLQTLSVRLNGQLLRGEQGRRIPCHLQAPNAWPLESTLRHQLATAAFVLPNHPLIPEVTREAVPQLGNASRPEEVFTALYDYFSTQWQIQYRFEPPSWGGQSQNIRWPHQVLGNTQSKAGEGTCIDLALLFAACLEYLGFQPLIAILDMQKSGDQHVWRHALVGCWRDVYSRDEAILRNEERIQHGVIWLDPNGCTRDTQYRQSFEQACFSAERQLADNRFVFTLDVSAARNVEQIRPLPFTGKPQWGSVASSVMEKAVASAQSLGMPVGSPNLLLGFLREKGEVTSDIFGQCDIDLDWAAQTIEERLVKVSPGKPLHTPPPQTENYKGALDRARRYAEETASAVISEIQLLRALLETIGSAAFENTLKVLGTSSQQLLVLLKGKPGNPDSSPNSNFSF